MLNSDFSENEKWLLTFLFVLDAYFNNCPNYFKEKSRELIEGFSSAGIQEDEIIKAAECFICEFSSQDNFRVSNIFDKDYLFFDSFYNDTDFSLTITMRET